MEGFIAKHPSDNEEWLVSRHGRRFRKAASKLTSIASVYRNTITTYADPAKSLAAYHAEKRKAIAKGFHITNFDSTAQPKHPKVKALVRRRARTVKIPGHDIPVEEC